MKHKASINIETTEDMASLDPEGKRPFKQGRTIKAGEVLEKQKSGRYKSSANNGPDIYLDLSDDYVDEIK